MKHILFCILFFNYLYQLKNARLIYSIPVLNGHEAHRKIHYQITQPTLVPCLRTGAGWNQKDTSSTKDSHISKTTS